MKKSLLNTLGAIGIMALIALNVYVVTSKETPAFLKWDAMSYIFANVNSGSGSGSGCTDSIWNAKCYKLDYEEGLYGAFKCDCEKTDDPNDTCSKLFT